MLLRRGGYRPSPLFVLLLGRVLLLPRAPLIRRDDLDIDVEGALSICLWPGQAWHK